MTDQLIAPLPLFQFSLIRPELGEEFCPAQTRKEDTGFDVRAVILDDEGLPSSLQIQPGQKALIPLGFRCFIPAGWWLQLNPRSSTFTKLGLSSLVGVIDEKYEGEVKFAVINTGTTPVLITHKDRVAQLIPYERKQILTQLVSPEEFEVLSQSRQNDRGAGGFGSSGK